MAKTTKTDEAAAGLHPVLEQHGTFAGLKLGRSEVRHDARTLRLATYIDEAALPAIPDAWDWASGVPSWPMYGNDRLGDCTIAAAGHLVQAWTTAAGAEVTPDDGLLEQAYIPGTGADDTGRVEVDVLSYWRKTGIAGHKIEAYAYLDPKDLGLLRAAIYLFGGVYVGIGLPKTAQGQAVWDVVGDGATGDSAPGSWGGHAVPYVAYDAAGLKTVTWGAVLGLTDAFHLAYCDEVYVPLSLDFFKDGHSPAGFDAIALGEDLAKIGKVEEPQASADADSVVEDLHGRVEGDPPAGALGDDGDVDVSEVREEMDRRDPGYYWNG